MLGRKNTYQQKAMEQSKLTNYSGSKNAAESSRLFHVCHLLKNVTYCISVSGENDARRMQSFYRDLYQ